MLRKHITINQLTIIEINYHNKVSASNCAKRMQLGKDKVYKYYNSFAVGKTVEMIYSEYKLNKSKCGKKSIELSEGKLEKINNKLDDDWSLDAIAGRERRRARVNLYAV